ncbi:MAG: hypothetical protein A3G25_15115 [Betaproteobacteria bacterium RIFCSPLOWO2_12_FULL_63_13]|nr:MAG: hypothetical protein A3H32_18170 [Betaproteobacteria bacterium RIFCSPLOWO2_02_FULL_63_19]OGA53828.1 MAG: hypothetical protein A3G25_15115 [Betaproteobacteria bacterium RIFCSPLOWO2_12_FULL_63_13]
MRVSVIALAVAFGIGAAACGSGSKPQDQAKSDGKTVDIIKTQREVLEKAKTVEATVGAAAVDRDKALEAQEGK